MSQNFTLYVYKQDRRTKSGERAVMTRVFTNETHESMTNMVAALRNILPQNPPHRVEFHPTTVTVKNLMTGQDVEIDRDTPWCCSPASETYWSN